MEAVLASHPTLVAASAAAGVAAAVAAACVNGKRLHSTGKDVPAVPDRACAEVNNEVQRCAVLRIDGMTCSNCSNAVTKVLESLQQVSRCEVDLINEKATVWYSSSAKFTANEICSEVEDIGFGATAISDAFSQSCAVLRIDGMTCSNCSNAVTTALENLEQVSRCEVDLINEKATVWYYTSAAFTVNEICSAVEDIGFGATTISNEIAKSEGGGTALLHLLDAETTADSASILRATAGVADVMVDSSLMKVTYDPEKVGARKLLQSLRAGKSGTGVKLAPPDLVAARSSAECLPAGLLTAVALTAAIVSVCWVLPCVEHCNRLLNKEVVPGLSVMMLLLCALATPVQFYSGRRFHVGAYHALRSGVWDMNVLVSLGSGLTFAYSFLVISFVVVGSRYYKFHHCKIPPSAFFEAPSVVVTCILVGKTLESWAKRNTSRSLRDLLKLQPPTAHLLTAGGTEAETVPVELLELGDTLQVFPGEAAPADGVLASEAGAAEFDESLLTGESRPVTKRKGDFIIGGSKCVSGRVELQVQRLGSRTMLSQIMGLVQKAQLNRANVQQVADAIAQRFVPFVVVLAILTWTTWYTLVYRLEMIPLSSILDGRMSQWPELDRFFFVLEHGLTVLLVACPCALGLATPTAVMAATGAAAKHGILVRTGAVPLELGSKISSVVLDKTGTLTRGRPQVTQVAARWSAGGAEQPTLQRLVEAHRQATGASARAAQERPTVAMTWLQEHGSAPQVVLPQTDAAGRRAQQRGEAERALWWAIGSAEMSSEHPVAKALVETAGAVARGPLTKPSTFENITGVGVRCTLAGLVVDVASATSVLELRSGVPAGAGDALPEWIAAMRAGGATVVALAVEGVPLAAVALQDALAPHARSCVASLQVAGVDVWMCSGDHRVAARSVARQCGIDESRVVAEALPADKVSTVERLRAQGGKGKQHKVVAMVGDGVNDAPALATADIGIAIGAGHDVTVEAADIVLVRSDLRDLAAFFMLSRDTLKTIKFNFLWAFVFNVCALPVAAGALWPWRVTMSPPLAACVMLSSSLFVCLNSLSLNNFKPARITWEA